MPTTAYALIYFTAFAVVITAVIILLKKRDKQLSRRAAKELIGALPDGRIPEKASISSYYKAKLLSEESCVDEITMNDLDFDKVYTKLDTCMTSPGEELLYSQLHFCEKDVCEKITALGKLMSEDSEFRLEIYSELNDLGIINYNGAADVVCGKPLDEFAKRKLYILYPLLPFIALLLMFISISAGSYPATALFLTLAVCAAGVNLVKFYSARKKLYMYMGASKYIAMLINRVGGCPLIEQPTSHTTVRTVRYTAVQ